MRPIVFLDIDDVLCVHRLYNTRQVLAALADNWNANAADVWQQIFHASARENLRQLHEDFSPQYVISSSWVLHLSQVQLRETFRRTSLDFIAENLHEFWVTPRDAENSYRLVEIELWIDTHALLAPVPYLIVDDHVSGQSLVGSHLEGHSVLCDACVGFMYPQLKQARAILEAQLSSAPGSRRQR